MFIFTQRRLDIYQIECCANAFNKAFPSPWQLNPNRNSYLRVSKAQFIHANKIIISMLLLLLLAYYRDERKHLNNTIIITKINLSKCSSVSQNNFTECQYTGPLHIKRFGLFHSTFGISLWQLISVDPVNWIANLRQQKVDVTIVILGHEFMKKI